MSVISAHLRRSLQQKAILKPATARPHGSSSLAHFYLSDTRCVAAFAEHGNRIRVGVVGGGGTQPLQRRLMDEPRVY